jgi:hypothetical protein
MWWSNFTVNVSAINSPNPNLYASPVTDLSFVVYGNPGKFYWVVHATRHAIEVESYKTNIIIKGNGPYTYI